MIEAKATGRDFLAIVLAAGEGTRMRSARPKVLHEVAGLSLIGHALASAQAAGAGRLAVVIGPERSDVANEIGRLAPGACIVEQRERRGTAHAVLQARPEIAQTQQAVVVLFGDTPLVRPETIGALASAVDGGGADVAVMGFEAADPAGYGRLIMQGEALVAIREHKDASAAERAIRLCNGGLMALSGDVALALLDGVGSANAQNEFYLTDCVSLAVQRGGRCRVVLVPEEEAQGVNDRAQLALCEAAVQRRLRGAHLAAGVTMIAPETVFFSMDTKIGRDVVIEPHCWFGKGVSVAEGATIHAFSHLEGAIVGEACVIGPYARLRPGAVLARKAEIGNFVEVNRSALAEGVKAKHLAYLGDATIGAGANIGAGTITCNYDGFLKHRTEIGAGAFIGTNSSLVAPVSIGAGAFVGSGSVITDSVPADALALGRGRQIMREGWAEAFRKRPENLARASMKTANTKKAT